MRIPIERINRETGEITGRGSASVHGSTLDYYETNAGTPLPLRPGEYYAIIVHLPVEGATESEG